MAVFELRSYALPSHNREHLYDRFRTDTTRIFTRLGFQVVGFWTVSIGPGEGDLVYLLRWDSATQRQEKWQQFAVDEEWRRVRETTNTKHGPLVSATHSTLLTATDFSPLQ